MEVAAFSRTSLEQLRVLPPLDRMAYVDEGINFVDRAAGMPPGSTIDVAPGSTFDADAGSTFDADEIVGYYDAYQLS